MKQVAFVVSHLGSDSGLFCESLDKNPRVQWFKSNVIYDHISTVEKLVDKPHKLKNAAAIWLDELLYNFNFSSKYLYSCCKFIYVIRPPKPTLSCIGEGFVNYYTYRLRRICEMARCTPGAVLLTWDDLVAGRLDLVENYLNLKEKIDPIQGIVPTKSVQWSILDNAQQSYEKYLYYLKNLNLQYF